MKRFIVPAVAALLVAAPGVAFATTQYPSQGGTWEYGNGQITAYSYYTVNKTHGSSIYRDGKAQSVSAKTVAGQKSIAEKKHAPWTGGFSYFYKLY